MNKKILVSILGVVILACFYTAEAQQPKKVPRIGFLIPSVPANYATRIETFREGLRELGYVEGKNIVVEYRFAEGKQDRLRELAAELVNLKVDLIVAAASARAAKDATKTIPIVFAAIADPVAQGIVASLARPGGNLTGVSVLAPELTGKRLELLKEAAPKVKRVAFLWNPSGPGDLPLFKEAEAASGTLGLRFNSWK
jgi:putative tryptophan/tyrosine transport system substrate-binding protein